MMLAYAFDPKVLNYDYAQFKANFLKGFDQTQTRDSFQ